MLSSKKKKVTQIKVPKGYGIQKREYFPFLVMIAIGAASWLGLYFIIGMSNMEIGGYLLVSILTSAALIIMFTYFLGRRK